jgi:hypothetical protein
MPTSRFLSRLFLGLGWRCNQEAADDLGGRLQDQEEHPQQEAANLAGQSLAIHNKLRRHQPGSEDQSIRKISQRLISSENKNNSKFSFQEQQLFSFR